MIYHGDGKASIRIDRYLSGNERDLSDPFAFLRPLGVLLFLIFCVPSFLAFAGTNNSEHL